MNKRKKTGLVFITVASLLFGLIIGLQAATQFGLTAKPCDEYVMDSTSNPECDSALFEREEQMRYYADVSSVVFGIIALPMAITGVVLANTPQIRKK